MGREQAAPCCDYVAWETQPPVGARQRPAPAPEPRICAGSNTAKALAAQQRRLAKLKEPEPESEPADGMTWAERILMEQLGQKPADALGTYFSEKLAVECEIPDEAGGHLSIMQDPSSEQKGHGEAGGVVWRCASEMTYHLCDRRYFPSGYWRGKRCLEIGAGTGILGLAAARLGAEVT